MLGCGHNERTQGEGHDVTLTPRHLMVDARLPIQETGRDIKLPDTQRLLQIAKSPYPDSVDGYLFAVEDVDVVLPPRDAEDGGRVLVTLARHVVLEEAPATFQTTSPCQSPFNFSLRQSMTSAADQAIAA